MRARNQARKLSLNLVAVSAPSAVTRFGGGLPATMAPDTRTTALLSGFQGAQSFEIKASPLLTYSYPADNSIFFDLNSGAYELPMSFR